MKKKFLVLALILNIFFYSITIAQNNTFNSVSIPNSNILSFTKLIENSANTFNGAININVPIDSIEIGGKVVPLNLVYNTSGIKVSEEAGCSGLGWNLNVGGFVMQNIIGEFDNKLDFQNILYYNDNHPENSIYPPASVNGHWGFKRDPSIFIYTEPIDQLTSPLCGWTDHYGIHELDNGKAQPDIYYFKFSNYTGKFFIDYRDNSINLIDKHSEIQFAQIYDENSNIIGWKAKIPDGTWFYFTEKEESYDFNNNNNLTSLNFNLTKIVFPNGEILNYEYEYIGICTSITFKTENYKQDIQNYCKGDYRFCSSTSNTPSLVYTENSTFYKHHRKVLKKIYSQDNALMIDFYYSGREDLPRIETGLYASSGDRKLDSLVFSNSDNTAKKKYVFTYDYFISPIVADDYVYNGGNQEHIRKRLRLLNLYKDGIPGYNFFYSSISLPSKQSYAQDYWGYYNGQNTNTRLLSNFWSFFHHEFQPSAEILPWSFISEGSYHYTDTSYLIAGMLTKIQHPTGGYTNFRYESNTFGNYYYPSKSQIQDYDEIKESQQINLPYASYKNANPHYCDGEDYFVELTSESKVHITYNFNWTGAANGFDDIINSSVTFGTVNNYNQIQEVLKCIVVQYNENGSFVGSFDLQVPAGRYGLYSYLPKCSDGILASIYAGIFIEPVNYVFPSGFFETAFGGGLRIKSIQNITDNNNTIKKFEYSNGFLMSPLQFYYSREKTITYSLYPPYIGELDPRPLCSAPLVFQYVTKSSSLFIPLSYDAQGALVGYRTVREYLTNLPVSNNHLLGYIEYEYNVFPPQVNFGVPSVPDPFNGKIKRQIFYNNNQKKVKQIDFYYNNVEFNRCFGHTQDFNQLPGCYYVYPLISSAIYNSGMSERLFDENEISYFKKGRSNFYNTKSQLIKKIDTLDNNADGSEKIVTTDIIYISDIVNPTNVYQQMINNHSIDYIKDMTVSVNGQITSKLVNNYMKCSDLYIPFDKTYHGCFNASEILTYPTGGNDFNIIQNIFDSKGNVIQQSINNEIKSCNVWGYNESKLIANVNNSNSNECAYTGFENNETNDWQIYEDNKINNEFSVTGKSSILVNNGYGPTKLLKVGLDAKNHNGYQASVWVKGDKKAYLHIEANTYDFSQRIENPFQDNQWHLIKVELPVERYENLINIDLVIRTYVGNNGSQDSFFDDLRVYPLDAQMTTYTYEPLFGITSKSDLNNKSKKYDYDIFGRLKLIRDFEGNIIKKIDYHYKRNNR
jgi:hypothetical protein